MPQQIDDPVLIVFEVGTLLLSIATGLYFIVGRFGRPPLSYVPRRPVPWTVVAGALAVLYVVTTLASVVQSQMLAGKETDLKATQVDKQEVKPETPSAAEELAGSMVLQLFIAGGFAFVIAFVSRATPLDLGLPTGPRELAHDVFIGVVASLVALAPVHALQALLAYCMGMGGKSGHPLVKTVTHGGPDLLVMLLASLAAVVAAPVCEEIAFRLLFQGWLEKWEDGRLGWRSVSLPAAVADEGVPAIEAQELVRDELRPLNLEVIGGASAMSTAEQPIDQPPPRDPPSTSIAGLPYGWLPILISALLFGVAHLGYGPEPVPLFFLGLVLGYVYQRTHRIVPCMVAHAVFNLFTMVVLWRMVFYGAH